jgi:hypothetical protein
VLAAGVAEIDNFRIRGEAGSFCIRVICGTARAKVEWSQAAGVRGIRSRTVEGRDQHGARHGDAGVLREGEWDSFDALERRLPATEQCSILNS